MPSPRRLNALVFLALIAPAAAAATHPSWRIESVAGNGRQGFGGDGGPAKSATLDNPFGVIRGPDGALWFCEYTGQRIRRIARDGTIATLAGTGAKGYSGDGGPALQATFNLPHEIRFDARGNLFVVDMANHAIRRIDLKTGVITTLAGDGQPGYSGDGAPIAGTPLRGPRSLDFDREGNLWLATREGNQVFRLDTLRGTIHHVAGTGKKGFTGHGGPARDATLSGPKGIAVDADGNVWLADTESHSVRMIDRRTGRLELIAGSGEKGDGPDGPALACRLARLHGIFADSDGGIYIGDSEAHRIRVIRPSPP